MIRPATILGCLSSLALIAGPLGFGVWTLHGVERLAGERAFQVLQTGLAGATVCVLGGVAGLAAAARLRRDGASDAIGSQS